VSHSDYPFKLFAIGQQRSDLFAIMRQGRARCLFIVDLRCPVTGMPRPQPYHRVVSGMKHENAMRERPSGKEPQRAAKSWAF
jgi:hypothetical protein